MPTKKIDESSEQEAPAAVDRRAFLGKGAVMAAAAVGAPALLAACDADATAPEARTAAAGGPAMAVGGCATSHVSRQPWWALHYTVAGTIGSTTYVKVPTLEKGTYGYTQRVITDDSRIGTALATILGRTTSGSRGAATVIVQDSRGRAWARRSISKQADLAYAMKDALSTNTLAYGVLRDSLTRQAGGRGGQELRDPVLRQRGERLLGQPPQAVGVRLLGHLRQRGQQHRHHHDHLRPHALLVRAG